ncbi:MAG TPA: PP2C family protein-serine/threonine phosphatase [Acidobacteriota bacterium]|nr:PP2C family protein-serine/threonine phosphatase [Acidobacteriota bacterium]
MRHSGLSARRVVDIRAVPPQRSDPGSRARCRELERKIAALQVEYTHLQSAIFEGAQLHRRLCAPHLVHQGGFAIASEIFAVRSLPGDFFTIIKAKAGDGIVLALGDICGKGLTAAMWATYLVGLVGAHATTSLDPQVIVTGVNLEVCRMSSVAPQATLFLARLDTATGRLDYCNAGHPPSLLLRADGQLETLSEGGTLLGAMPEASYDTGRVALHAGDVLLAYSDGVLEARNKADEEFGYERIETQLHLARSVSADAILFSVLGAVQDFASPRPLVDDTSLVVIRHIAN